ncbi:MAG: PorP/SprF family type IX secretion system membrane protein [Bacteroidales bacterium]
MRCSFFCIFLAIILVALLKITSLQAQDVNFNMPYHSPLVMNPAYSGSENHGRIGVNYRNSWAAFGSPYETYAVFADYYFPKFKSGLGIYILNDKKMDGALNQTSFAFSYSYNLRIAENSSFRFGIQATLNLNAIVGNLLIFPDMIDPTLGIVAGSSTYPNNKKLNFDLPIGCVFSHRNFYLGIAARRLMQNSSNQDFEGIPYSISPRVTFHGGYNIILRTSSTQGLYGIASNNSVMSLSPCFYYSWEGLAQVFSAGTYWQASQVMLGIFYRTVPRFSAQFFSAMIGYAFKTLTISYAFDVGLFTQAIRTSPPLTHEFALIFKLKYKSQLIYNVRTLSPNMPNAPLVNFL